MKISERKRKQLVTSGLLGLQLKIRGPNFVLPKGNVKVTSPHALLPRKAAAPANAYC